MKKICFFSGDITRGGGTERVAAMIANGLARQGKYKILFLSLVEQAPEPFFSLEPGIERYALGKKWIQPGPGYLGVLPKLRRFLKKQDISVLIDIDLVLDVLSVPMSKGLSTKVISWGHFSFYFERESLYRRLIQDYSAKRSDYIITINQENREQYETVLARTERIRTIYNPVEEPGVRPEGGREKWILSVGRMETIKGIDHLLDAAAVLLPKHRDWKWIAAGDGSQMSELLEKRRALGLEEQVDFPGRVEHVEEYYRKASVFALTSRSEGLPMCLLEAKTYGLPCVSFDIHTGPREIIRDGLDGFLAAPYDCEELAGKLELLMNDTRLRERFSENAGGNLDKFRMEDILAAWNEVIEELCS